jgi:hypothetical protein
MPSRTLPPSAVFRRTASAIALLLLSGGIAVLSGYDWGLLLFLAGSIGCLAFVAMFRCPVCRTRYLTEGILGHARWMPKHCRSCGHPSAEA